MIDLDNFAHIPWPDIKNSSAKAGDSEEDYGLRDIVGKDLADHETNASVLENVKHR